MSNSPITRRRVITIMAAACATAVAVPSPAASYHEWRGTALGAEGRLILSGIDKETADGLISRTIAEIDRLEQVFSLYRPASEISRLNREGRLRYPSHDFQVVIAVALDMWRRSDGAFNPAIQPIWQMLRDHFSGNANTVDPDPAGIAAILEHCDPARINLAAGGIGLEQGMALTLNGIAQGYITDQVAALLRQNGLSNTLVQLGETRALPGRAWNVEIAGSGRFMDLEDGAVATSAGGGTPFTGDGRWHHLLDPSSGRSRHDFSNVTVFASSAMTADALSTALAVAGQANITRIACRFPHTRILAQRSSGGFLDFGA